MKSRIAAATAALSEIPSFKAILSRSSLSLFEILSIFKPPLTSFSFLLNKTTPSGEIWHSLWQNIKLKATKNKECTVATDFLTPSKRGEKSKNRSIETEPNCTLGQKELDFEKGS
jgi:hypothetical protein